MDKEFMNQAVALSLENVRSGRGGPFGAVVVKDGQVIASGANEVTAMNDPTAHAEIVAIRAACRELGTFQLSGCDLYTSCEPCPMCLGAIYWARPDRVYFANSRSAASAIGFDDDFIYSEMPLPHNQRKIHMEQTAHEGAGSAFAAWEELLNKVKY